jgi:hypothetical protein
LAAERGPSSRTSRRNGDWSRRPQPGRRLASTPLPYRYTIVHYVTLYPTAYLSHCSYDVARVQIVSKRKIGAGRGGLHGEKKCAACTERKGDIVLLKECGGRFTNHTGPVERKEKMLRDQQAKLARDEQKLEQRKRALAEQLQKSRTPASTTATAEAAATQTQAPAAEPAKTAEATVTQTQSPPSRESVSSPGAANPLPSGPYAGSMDASMCSAADRAQWPRNCAAPSCLMENKALTLCSGICCTQCKCVWHDLCADSEDRQKFVCSVCVKPLEPQPAGATAGEALVLEPAVRTAADALVLEAEPSGAAGDDESTHRRKAARLDVSSTAELVVELRDTAAGGKERNRLTTTVGEHETAGTTRTKLLAVLERELASDEVAQFYYAGKVVGPSEKWSKLGWKNFTVTLLIVKSSGAKATAASQQVEDHSSESE